MTYANKGKVNGPAVEPPKSSGGGYVAFPAGRGLFGKKESLASKLVIGPKRLEGLGRGLFGPYW
jgi:hypothetical protein